MSILKVQPPQHFTLQLQELSKALQSLLGNQVNQTYRYGNHKMEVYSSFSNVINFKRSNIPIKEYIRDMLFYLIK
jgi:hypothetical protein